MRILILGNNSVALEFFNMFENDSSNIVFSTAKEAKNYIEFASENDIVDFSSANEINLVLITDESFVKSGVAEKISSLNISVFAPSLEALEISSSKAYAKRFIYKNKITTPKFSIVERLQTAYDYVKQNPLPFAIKPDKHSFSECPVFVDTKQKAFKTIDKLMNSDNQKIIIEDYVEGKNISVWVISDGYSAKIIGINAKYQNNVSVFEPEFVTDEIRDQIYNEIVKKTIETLSANECEYIGILGFDIILSYDGTINLIGFNSFFDEISAPFFARGFEINWMDVFESCLIGDIFQKYYFEKNESHMAVLRQGEEIEFVCAKTKASLEKKLRELSFDLKEFDEAEKLWKY